MKTKKQFAVIGLGRFGASLARTLFSSGYDVLAIDSDEARVQKYSDEFTQVVQADTTDENALKALGLHNFDVVVVSIGENIQANILTTLILKELGVAHIVAKARNLIHGRMLEKIGADKVVYPERDMGMRIAHYLMSNNVLEYIKLSSDLSLIEVSAPKALIGLSLAKSGLRESYGLNVLAIKRGDNMIVPLLPAEIIKADDVLIIVGTNAGMQKFEELR